MVEKILVSLLHPRLVMALAVLSQMLELEDSLLAWKKNYHWEKSETGQSWGLAGWSLKRKTAVGSWVWPRCAPLQLQLQNKGENIYTPLKMLLSQDNLSIYPHLTAQVEGKKRKFKNFLAATYTALC